MRRIEPMPGPAAGLRRNAPLRSRSPRRRQVVTAAPRDTGPSAKVRGLVLARDNWQCVACGKPAGGACTWWSIQHRVARGVGGGNDPANLILLCGSATSAGCHRKCEDRDERMHVAGYWLNSWEDPAAVPVMVRGEQGGVTVWLTSDGQYSTVAPGGDAA